LPLCVHLLCVHVRVRLSRCSDDTVRRQFCQRHRAITISAQCRSTVGALSARHPGRRPSSPPQAEEFKVPAKTLRRTPCVTV